MMGKAQSPIWLLMFSGTHISGLLPDNASRLAESLDMHRFRPITNDFSFSQSYHYFLIEDGVIRSSL